jgi:hypothetical protein
MKTTKIACRSETCNVDIINSNTFRLDLTMAGQDCNTQSAVGHLAEIFRTSEFEVFLMLYNPFLYEYISDGQGTIF